MPPEAVHIYTTKHMFGWDDVEGTCTSWEIAQKMPDGSTIKSTKKGRTRTARTSTVGAVLGIHVVTVTDLPRRSRPVTLTFNESVGPPS